MSDVSLSALSLAPTCRVPRTPVQVAAGYVTDRTVIEELGEVVSVKSLGVLGDGETDDGPAILRAVAAAETGTLRFPPGTYRIDNSGTDENPLGYLQLGGFSGTLLFDRGAKLLLTDPTKGGVRIYGGTDARIDGINIEYETRPTTRINCHALFIDSTTRTTLINSRTNGAPGIGTLFYKCEEPQAAACKSLNSKADGFDFVGCKNARSTLIYVYNSGDDGFAIFNQTDATDSNGGVHTNITVRKAGSRGIAVDGAPNTYVSDFHVDGTVNSGLIIQGSNTGSHTLPAHNVTFANGIVRNAGQNPGELTGSGFQCGFAFDSVISCRLEGVSFFNCKDEGLHGGPPPSDTDVWVDLAIDAADNTKVSSASLPFGRWMAGTTLNVTGGTGFTVQSVTITAVDQVTDADDVTTLVATCSQPLGTVGSTGGKAQCARINSVEIVDVTVDGCGSNGANIGAKKLYVSGLKVRNARAYGVYISRCTYVDAVDVYVENSGQDQAQHRAIWFEQNTALTASNLRAFDDQATPTGYVIGEFNNTAGNISGVFGTIVNGSLSTGNTSAGVSLSILGVPSFSSATVRGTASKLLTVNSVGAVNCTTELNCDQAGRLVRLQFSDALTPIFGFDKTSANLIGLIDLVNTRYLYRTDASGNLVLFPNAGAFVIHGANCRDPLVGKTADYTATTADNVITVDATAGPVTITLPTAVGITGMPFTLLKVDASANAVTVATTSAQTINGVSTWTLSARYDTVRVVSNSANWYVVKPSTHTHAESDVTGLASDLSYRRKRYMKGGGLYHTNLFGSGLSTSATQGNAVLRLQPFHVPRAVTLTRIGCEVTTIGEAGSKYRLGIYADDGTGYPGAIVLDAGQIAGDSATVQEITISQSLAAGDYWIGGAVQSVTTTQPTFRTYSASDGEAGYNVIPGAGAIATGYTQTGVTGSLPSTFTATVAQSSQLPVRIFVKVT